MTSYMFECLETRKLKEDANLTLEDLNVLSSVIERNLRNINKRLETLKAHEMTPCQTQMQPPTTGAMPEETKLVNNDVSEMNANGDNLQL